MSAWKLPRVILASAALLLLGLLGATASPLPTVLAIRVTGTIDPATAAYSVRAINKANRDHDALLLIQLDTPGGMVDSTKDIIKAMLASEVPIAVYVSPQGAMAASAGTYITIAAQIAAMAPTTHIGSATPIASTGKDLDRKVTNAMSSYIQTLAQRRGRNAEWAIKAVQKGVSATETQALKLHVIDLIAPTRSELLKEIDGRKVHLAEDQLVTLHTARAQVVDLPMSPQESLMHTLADPNVVMFLVLIAIYGLIAEVSNPGAILPGVVGGIALILVLYSSNVLPLNMAALLLLIFAVALFLIDAHVPTHGILTTGGIIAMGLGLFLLVDTENPLFRTSIVYVILGTAATGAFFVFAIGAGIRAQKRKVTTGYAGLVGRVVEAKTDINPVGSVFLEGAWWTAESTVGPIEMGERVVVQAVRGLRLFVGRE